MVPTDSFLIKMLGLRLARAFSKANLEVADIAALMFTVRRDMQGALQNILQSLLDNKMNLTHIESKPASILDADKGFTFIVDVQAPETETLHKVVGQIREICGEVAVMGSVEVPWFPRNLQDLNSLKQKIYELPQDHPGFDDRQYIQRRTELGELAMKVSIDSEIPLITYNEEERQTWTTLYRALTPLLPRVACSEFQINFKEMEDAKLINEYEVPQVKDVNKWLYNKSGFQLKPIAAMGSDREFLNCLAFRVFPTTWHMRHHSQPYFSMDPDVCHEVLGHVPMLADPEFAHFVQEIGLASLGASDEDIERLMRLYFFSVELGTIMGPSGKKEAYGARILSSVDEINHCLSIRPEWRYFDPFQACNKKYHRRHLQKMYWFNSDFREAKILVERFAQTLSKPFHASYDRSNKVIRVDHNIKRV